MSDPRDCFPAGRDHYLKSLQKLGAIGIAATQLALHSAAPIAVGATILATGLVVSACPSPMDSPNPEPEPGPNPKPQPPALTDTKTVETEEGDITINIYDNDSVIVKIGGTTLAVYSTDARVTDNGAGGYIIKDSSNNIVGSVVINADNTVTVTTPNSSHNYTLKQNAKDGCECEEATCDCDTMGECGGAECDCGYDELGFDKNGYDRDGFDADGWDIDGYGRDGFNADNWDRDGYDRDGYSADGWDRQGYGRDGYNEDGKHKNGPAIPAYTLYSTGEVTNINFDETIIGGNKIGAGLAPAAGDSEGSRQSAVYSKWYSWFCRMLVQNENLVSGYSAVKSAYAYPDPELPNINNIITNENSMKNTLNNTNDIASYLTAANGNIDTILNNIIPTGERAVFDNYLSAYRNGTYYNTRIWDDGSKKTDAETAYRNALTASGLAYEGDPAGNINAILAALETAMRTQIDNATGIGAVDSAHTATIRSLNTGLIMQIQDLQQAGATADDLKDHLGYNNVLGLGQTLSQRISNNGGNKLSEPGDAEPQAPLAPADDHSVALQGTNKAAHLANGFDAELLKLHPYVKDEKSGIAIA